LTDLLESVLAKQELLLSSLTNEEVEIKAVFYIKTDEEGETKPSAGAPVKLRKISPEFKLFMKDKPDFILIFDYHAWKHVSPEKREPMIHETLRRISVERNQAGALKLRTLPHAIQTDIATAQCYGAWNPALVQMKDALRQRLMPYGTSENDDPEAYNHLAGKVKKPTEEPAAETSETAEAEVAAAEAGEAAEAAEEAAPEKETLPTRTNRRRRPAVGQEEAD